MMRLCLMMTSSSNIKILISFCIPKNIQGYFFPLFLQTE